MSNHPPDHDTQVTGQSMPGSVSHPSSAPSFRSRQYTSCAPSGRPVYTASRNRTDIPPLPCCTYPKHQTLVNKRRSIKSVGGGGAASPKSRVGQHKGKKEKPQLNSRACRAKRKLAGRPDRRNEGGRGKAVPEKSPSSPDPSPFSIADFPSICDGSAGTGPRRKPVRRWGDNPLTSLPPKSLSISSRAARTTDMRTGTYQVGSRFGLHRQPGRLVHMRKQPSQTSDLCPFCHRRPPKDIHTAPLTYTSRTGELISRASRKKFRGLSPPHPTPSGRRTRTLQNTPHTTPSAQCPNRSLLNHH